MFGIEVGRFKDVVKGDTVYKIPIIGLLFSTEKASHPDRFANIGEPYTSNNQTYVNIPITKDSANCTKLASYIVQSCGDSRVIFWYS